MARTFEPQDQDMVSWCAWDDFGCVAVITRLRADKWEVEDYTDGSLANFKTMRQAFYYARLLPKR